MTRNSAPTPVFSLITVSFNSSQTLRQHWKPLSSPGVEWIVVDNASSDNSVDVARSLGARVIPLETNVGFGAANNIALAQARGSVVGIINPDVEFDPDDLDLIANALAREDALVAPQLLNPDRSPQPNGRGTPSLPNKVANRLSDSWSESRGFQRYASVGETVPVEWLTGAVIFARRDTLAYLGGFDERFFVYFEDADLGIRAGDAGVRSLVLGDAQWIHSWARESTGLNFAGWRREFASAIKFYAKHPRKLMAMSESERNR